MAGSSATYSNFYLTGPGVTWTPQSGSLTITDSSDSVYVLGSGETITLSGGLSGSATIQSYDAAKGELVIKQGSNFYYLSNDGSYTDLPGDYVGLASGGDYIYCFLAGTGISTAIGIKPIEDLQVGDEVITINGSVAKVRFNFIQMRHGHSIFANKEHYPICIKAGALADNVPSRDLYVTPDHAIYFPEWAIFAQAHTLINEGRFKAP